MTRPRAEDLLDIKPLRLELAWRLYSCGRPRWDHPTSVPPPQPAMGVEGLQPAGLIGATEAMGRALFARLRAQGAINPDDNTEEEFAA